MHNRLLALLLTALMVWTLAVPALGANPFFDVPEDHWAYDAVEYLAEAGLIEGYPDGTFGGARNFTRYEMALVFARIVARFEQYVDQLVQEGISTRLQGIENRLDGVDSRVEGIDSRVEGLDTRLTAVESRLDELAAQVAEALKEASEALRAASEARDVVEVPEPVELEVPVVDPEQIEAALEAARRAQELAEQAMQVAVGTLEVIDARDWEGQMADHDAQISAAAARAQQALEAAQKAVADAEAAMEVAVGTLEAIDARDWEGQIARTSEEARAASALAAEALAAAEKALLAAKDAMDVASGTLEAIDARDYDARIESAAAAAEQAMELAQRAAASAEQALATADAAMQVAIGTLEAIDARDWEGQIASAAAKADEASAKADEALALARSIALVSEPDGEELPVPRPSFTDEARAAIEEIAARVVMDRLAEVKARADEIAAEVSDIRTDLDAAKALIGAEADRLERAILDLTQEFAYELETLGVRVAALEAKFTSLDSRVATLESDVGALKQDVGTLRTDLDVLGTTVDEHGSELVALRAEVEKYRISGFNEIRGYYGVSEGTATILNNPRDPDAGAFDVPKPGVSNRLQVRLDGKPNDEVDLVALVDLVLDTRSGRALGAIMRDSYAFAELTTEQPVRLVRLGYLDSNRVAEGHSPQVLDAKTFDQTRNIGLFTNIVSEATDKDLFVAYVLQKKQMVAGLSTDLALGVMDARIGAVRLFDETNPRTGVELGASMETDDFTASAQAIIDVENQAQNYRGSLELPIGSATLTGTLQRIHPVWADDSLRLPFAAEIKRQDPNKADKVVDVNNDVFAGQSLIKGRIDVPIGSFMAFAQGGRYRSGATVDMFTQFGVSDLNLLGFETEYIRSQFVQTGTNKTLVDNRASFTTQLNGIGMKLELNHADDEQTTVPEDAERTQFMVTLTSPITILVPWNASLNFGVNLSDAAPNSMHTGYKLEFKDYQVLADVSIGAEISGESGVIRDGKWRLNSTWTDASQTKQAVDAKWRVAEPLTLTAGLEFVNHSVDGRTTTRDAGAEYLMAGAFGGDLTLGYGYRVVYRNGTIDGTPRNVLSAAFTRKAGDFTLTADAKHYIGGTSGEPGNDVDTVASLKLSYPVFKGAAFMVDGKYVSSSGSKADEYTATSLTAGLRFNF